MTPGNPIASGLMQEAGHACRFECPVSRGTSIWASTTHSIFNDIYRAYEQII